MITIKAADLFAGAGGASTGLSLACESMGAALDLVAINHWPTAVQTHSVNHPHARHYCASVEAVDPREAIPGGTLDLLIAAPECTHHSTARGGKPINDQSRASAWRVLRWLELLKVDRLILENVPEFRTWGPIGANNRPLKSRKGETFRAFVAAIESLNYRVEWRILNAADYGEATTRRRLFLQARRGRKPIAWPEPTHAPRGTRSLFGAAQPWRAARDVIDWSKKGGSVFGRKKPLAPATMRRIVEGLRRFGGERLQPFIVAMEHGGRVVSADEPLPTITTAKGGAFGVVEPFIFANRTNNVPKSVDDPVPALCTADHVALVEPFLVPFYGENGKQTPRTHDVGEPLPVIPASAAKFGLVEPFVVQFRGTSDDQIDGSARDVDAPLGTISAGGVHHAIVEPFLLGQQSQAMPRPVTEPAPTISTAGAIALVEPYLTQYYGTGDGVIPVTDPVPTVTTHDRFARVEPIVIDGKALDIRFRMLQPHELSAAMGFPPDYEFQGNKTETVKQIGNAISVRTMRALCQAALAERVETERRKRTA